MIRIRRTASMLLCLIALPALAQQYKAGKVTFQNMGSYDQASLAAVSGLHPGSTFDQPGLQKSVQTLMDTGLFDDVQVKMSGPFASLDLILVLKPIPAAQLLPIAFSNFVWWSPTELAVAIRKSVPLFRGALPEAGNQLTAIENALQQMLAEKGIASATVTHEIVEPATDHPTRVIRFEIGAPDIRIHTVSLTGISPDMRDTLGKATAHLANAPYNEDVIAEALLTPYRNAGYFAARISDEHHTPNGTANTINVDVTAAIQPGDLFHVSGISFSGTPLMSSEDFMKTSKIHADDLLSLSALSQTLAPLDAAYRKNGYLDVVVNATPTLDEPTHHVAYTVTVNPGEQYHLRSVTPINLPAQKLPEFQAAFKLHPGDLYNVDYVKTFLVTMRAVQHQTALPSSYKAAADPGTHLVDLTITFEPAH